MGPTIGTMATTAASRGPTTGTSLRMGMLPFVFGFLRIWRGFAGRLVAGSVCIGGESDHLSGLLGNRCGFVVGLLMIGTGVTLGPWTWERRPTRASWSWTTTGP